MSVADDDRARACCRAWAETLLSNPRVDAFWAGWHAGVFYGGARCDIDFPAVEACAADTRPWRLAAGDFLKNDKETDS